MRIDKYHLKSDETLTIFEFISVGPKAAIRKIIHFQPTYTPGLYNLAFGDKESLTGEIDDLTVTNNADTDKVLATVVSALYTFLDNNPEALVYATGSTPARTRLYRMGITRFYKEMLCDFYLFGRLGKEFYEFEIGREYEGFLAQRKFAQLADMKKIDELNNSRVPIVAIDTSLNKYQNKTLFPKKLALANEQLKGVKLPSKKHSI